ncbi:MAG: NAD(P)H-binding protein [Candidatus Zixiibacteriota bacterium]|nr:MAG: NAD(P)H-binding protein [candidate division Zixibacteria bacterium]
MTNTSTHAVTGAFGYTGRYVAERLLDQGHKVITLTNSPDRFNPFGSQVQAIPFNFDQPDVLAQSLQGVNVLYNTYWVRFNHRLFTHADAVRNTLTLFEAALKAGVERIVHVSITNPSEDSPLEYFSGKARLETALKSSGLSYAVLRPTVIFGAEDILINNIAWMLRKLPVVGVFGDGRYRLQPIYVEDMADLAVREGMSRTNTVIDAIGPETFTYRELIETIGKIIGVTRPIVSVPPSIGYLTARILGWFVGDVILTRPEIEGLMADLLYTDSPPAGATHLTDWAVKNRDRLGRAYASELRRRKNRRASYAGPP